MPLSPYQGNIENYNWVCLDNKEWNSVPSLGPEWLAKWIYSKQGYSLLLCNGMEMWGEQRNAAYIEERALEWAACLEADVKQLSLLVLSQLEKSPSEIMLIRQGGNGNTKIAVELTASLDLLPYSWMFYLTQVPSETLKRHWSIPIATTMQMMSVKIAKLQDEIRKQRQFLEDTLPLDALPKQLCLDKLQNQSTNLAVNKILDDGIAEVISSHLNSSVDLISQIDARRLEMEDSRTVPTETKGTPTKPHNRPKLKKPGSFSELVQEISTSEESERREKIQAITVQRNLIPHLVRTKKKKLNI